MPDTLLDRATLPHQSIQAVPDGVTTSVIDPLTIQASSLLRTPAYLPDGLGTPHLSATQRNGEILFAKLSYLGDQGSTLEISFAQLFTMPLDIVFNPDQPTRVLETLRISGRNAVLRRPLPGMPSFIPAAVIILDGTVRVAIRGIGFTADEVLTVAYSLFPNAE